MTALTLRIKQLREVRGWSQAELARRTGVSQGMISRLENRRVDSIHMPTLEKLARALDVDPGYLIVKKGKGR